MVWTALTLILACIVFVVIAEAGRDQLLARIALAAAVGWSLYCLWRYLNPGQPLLVLSPEGVLMHIKGATEFLVPWSEIHDIVQITIAARNYGPRFQFRVALADVTALVVSQAFYDRHIHVDSLYRRGPGWANTFVPANAQTQKGGQMHIALHHALLEVPPETLRRAVETRWHAFRDAGQAHQGTLPGNGHSVGGSA